MSRLSRLSPEAIRAMFSSESDQTLIMLLTIYDPANEEEVVFRFADNYTQRLDEPYTTDEEVVYGVRSREQDYVFLPMEVSLPAEQDTGVGSCNLKLQYVTREAIELIRTELNKPTKIQLELVLSGSPGVVEAIFPGFYITSATYNADSIQFDLTMINLAREPFPCYNFIPSYFPGLF
jgi:hypothetical protein